MMLKRFKPNVWCMFLISPRSQRLLLTAASVPACMLVFGVTMLAQGFGKERGTMRSARTYTAIVKTYSGLLATRFFLGFAEAGVFPGRESFNSCTAVS